MSAEDKRKPSFHRPGSSTGGDGGGAPPGRSSALPAAPPGFHPIRRSMTADTTAQFRRRSTVGQDWPDHAFESSRRRYSTISDDILNPSGVGLESHESSNWASVPLAFGLLPAIGGLFFQNGSAVATDAMLLGLAAIFLHWSVTQPWIWYHLAQEVQVREETATIGGMDESEEELPSQQPAGTKSTNGVLDGADGVVPEAASTRRARDSKQQALSKLRLHELMALASCFVCPVMGTVLLYTIRNQLSRPSEGLVSNYNLTIFLLAAEIRPAGQLMKLIQARTLYLHRIVDANPNKAVFPAPGEMDDVLRRLEELESRASENRVGQVREVRKAVQPDLDALNRAVRQYEKRTAMLALRTDTRLGRIDTRLNDAVALAAAAAQGNTAQRSFLGWLAEGLVEAAMIPPQAILKAVAFPIRATSNILGWSDRVPLKQGKRGVGRDRALRS